MVIQRGEIWWAELPAPSGSEPGYRRPVLVVQADTFNKSRLQTVLVVAMTSHLELAALPGNVLVRATESGLPRDSVANVSQILTIDRQVLTSRGGRLAPELMLSIGEGMRLTLDLW